MKTKFRWYFIFFSLLLVGCAMDNSEFAPHTNEIDLDRMLIVLSAPSVNNDYYADVHQQIIDFQIDYANMIIDNDNVIIVVDRQTRPLFDGKVPADILLEGNIEDIWVRDFTTVNPRYPVRFKYYPSYFERVTDGVYIQNTFERFAKSWNVDFEETDLIIDGGNIVDNYNNMAITTERFLEDNNLTYEAGLDVLADTLGTDYVAIIPYDDDVMGHADGMVMFAEENKLLLNKYDEPFRSQVLEALKGGLPATVEIIEVEADFDDSVWDVFASACGINLNSTMTYEHIYVPVFGGPLDDQAVEIITVNTTKTVHKVDASGVCFMGGSVRCLSWQVAGENAKKLIEAARE